MGWKESTRAGNTLTEIKALVKHPEVQGFAADIALETIRRLVVTQNHLAGETKKATLGKVAGIIFAAAESVINDRVDKVLPNAGPKNSRS